MKPLPPIVALSGKAGSGKDTLGRRALKAMGYTQFALAWHMKNEAVGGFATWEQCKGECSGCQSGFCDGPFRKITTPSYEEVHFDKPPHIRSFLQHRGTEDGWMKYGKNYWLRIADAWMRTLRENCGLDRFYITDVRFPHEVSWVLDQGGVVIRIVGRGGLEGEAANHHSETALDEWPFTHYVNNGGIIEDAVEEIRKIVRNHK